MIEKEWNRSPEGEEEVRARVREFYDSVGWKQVGEGLYQNARYEDLRSVSRDYIQRCHRRVTRHLQPSGRFILDAGSGPVQYPEYLEYSARYSFRVCLDISQLALQEARKRLGEHGLYVVGDIAHLPFRREVFDGLVSLHTVHHLVPSEQLHSFTEFQRVMGRGSKAVVVYSWGEQSALVRWMRGPVQLSFILLRWLRRIRRQPEAASGLPGADRTDEAKELLEQGGTYTFKFSSSALREELGKLPGLKIRVWRSFSTSMLRAFIHRRLMGRQILQIVYWLEEAAPGFFGRFGQYPMLLFGSPSQLAQDRGES